MLSALAELVAAFRGSHKVAFRQQTVPSTDILILSRQSVPSGLELIAVTHQLCDSLQLQSLVIGEQEPFAKRQTHAQVPL